MPIAMRSSSLLERYTAALAMLSGLYLLNAYFHAVPAGRVEALSGGRLEAVAVGENFFTNAHLKPLLGGCADPVVMVYPRRHLAGAAHPDRLGEGGTLMMKVLGRALGTREGLARRIYFAFLLAAVIPTAIAGIIGVTLSLHTLREETLRNLQQEVTVRAQGVSLFFDQLGAELLYLAEAPALAELSAALREGDAGRIRMATAHLERGYTTLAAAYPHIYQIRFIGADGGELVRVDRVNDVATVVPVERLQNKADRYYFRETLLRPQGRIYLSPLDLNVEHGMVEQPERPVIRIATPVGDGTGAKDGVLIINLHADILLAQVEQMASARSGTAYLFDRAGHFLSRTAGERASLVMQPVATLTDWLGKNRLNILLDAAEGTLSAGGNILAHAAVEFGQAYARPEGARWVLAVGFPERALLLSVINLYVLYAVLAVALLATAFGGYALSRRLLGPIDALSRETEVIARGDFSHRVSIAGTDEIAQLGAKFNRMTDRLAELNREQEAHRGRLEEEVAARTRDLDRERASLATIIEQSGDGILVVDGEGLVTLANSAAASLLGAGQPELGEGLAQRWPEWPQIAAQVDAGGPLRRDMLLRGRVLALSVTRTEDLSNASCLRPCAWPCPALPVPPEAPAPVRAFVVVVRDVSDERRLADERRELDRQMFQMDKLATLGELAMGLAHEIGNPLAGMKAVAQALQYEEDLQPGVREALQRFEAETDRLSAFLKSFHGFAAPGILDLRPVRLAEALEDILFWTRKEARNQGVDIDTELAADLPPLQADLPQLKQVLLNLLVNAMRAMPEGGALAIAAAMEGGRMRIDIRDSGCGILPEVLPRIFEPFFTTRAEGSGLGLAIVAKIVREHGAEIRVASAPRLGTCFTLLWPIISEPSCPTAC